MANLGAASDCDRLAPDQEARSFSEIGGGLTMGPAWRSGATTCVIRSLLFLLHHQGGDGFAQQAAHGRTHCNFIVGLVITQAGKADAQIVFVLAGFDFKKLNTTLYSRTVACLHRRVPALLRRNTGIIAGR